MQKTLAFAEFESFYSLFRPLTPYGRLYREKRHFFSTPAALKTEYDLTSATAVFITSRKEKGDRLRFHLRNIPMLDLAPQALCTTTGLFLARKFLANAKDIFALLPAGLRLKFEAKWQSTELLALLNRGGAGEAFHIADSYCPELAAERLRIAACDASIKNIRERRFKQLRELWGLDFSDRDFLVIEEKAAARFSVSPDFFIEPFDGAHVTIKPVYGPDYREATAERDRLRAQEQELEAKTVKLLAAAVTAQGRVIEAYITAIEKIDVAAERARLAVELKLTRPLIHKYPSPVRILKGRFLPLELKLHADGLKYTPLSAVFTRRVNIIYGSNMGGKTVLLKTLAFLQLTAQSGFFTPAAAFETCLFDAVTFIGAAEMETAGGLSGFGLEMNEFAATHAKLKRENVLILLDEFARTTNSEEAAALLSAILEDLGTRTGAFSFLATHFSGLRPGKQAANFKMRGFDTAAFNDYFCGRPACGLDDKLKMINRFMRYELLEGGTGEPARDAIKIAEILGVTRPVIRRAQEFLEEKNETGKK